MAEIISPRKVFEGKLKEHLEGLGVDYNDLTSYRETKSDYITVATKNSLIKIEDPMLVRAAKVADLEESADEQSYNERTEALLQLYGREVAYGTEPVTWPDFLISYGSRGLNDIISRSQKADEQYAVIDGTLKEEASLRLYETLLEKIPDDSLFEYCVESMTEREILVMLARLSIDPDNPLAFVYNEGRTIIIPRNLVPKEGRIIDIIF